MQGLWRSLWLFTWVTAVVAQTVPARAAGTIEVDKDKKIKVGFLLQSHLRTDQDGNADGLSWSVDPFVRRARIMLYGQYTDLVHFFVETDQPNWGKGGNWESTFFVQDAWVEFNLHEALQIDVGMLLIPFSHHGSQGATSLLMLDYHGALIKYLPGTHKVWRDMGVMARGEFLNKMFEYRLALTNGVQTGLGADPEAPNPEGFLNNYDVPWVSGRMVLNLFDPEGGAGAGGFYADGIYLKNDGDRLISPKRILSGGISGNFQPDAAYGGADGTKSPYVAMAADIFTDYPLGDGTMSLNGQANFYYYNVGETHPNTGIGALVEFGFRCGRFQPVFGFDWFESFESNETDMMGGRVGFNWWILGHTANLKAEVGGQRIGESDRLFTMHGLLQAQLLF